MQVVVLFRKTSFFLEFFARAFFNLVGQYSKPEEKTDGHEDAAAGYPGTFSLPDSRALPEGAFRKRKR